MDKKAKEKNLSAFGSLEINIGNLNYFDEFVSVSSSNPPRYTYAFNTPALANLEKDFGISEIAGSGTVKEKTIAILHWVHSKLKPGGASVEENNSRKLLSYHLGNPDSTGLDCFQYCTVFLEFLLALRIKARIVFLEGFNPNQGGNHVVVIVYNQDLNQWMMFDPQHRTYFSNGNGEVMNPFQLRTALVQREDFHCIDYDYYGYWDKECYLTFLAKSLFSFICLIASEYNARPVSIAPAVWLHPKGFDPLKRAIKMNKWYEHHSNGHMPNTPISPDEYEEYRKKSRNIYFTSNANDMFG